MRQFKFISTMCLFLLLCSAGTCTEKEPVFKPGQNGGGSTELPGPPTNPGNPDTPATPDTPTEPGTPVTPDPDAPKKYVCLSFDDGPTATTSVQVLDLLEQHGVRASFFVIGSRIDNNKTSAKKIMERGVALGCDYHNHSYSHIRMGKDSDPAMTKEQIEEEVKKTSDLIKEITGKDALFFRPPYLDRNDLMHENIDLCFISGVSTGDSRTSTTTQMRIDAVLNGTQDGDIYLMHDFGGNTMTVEALKTIIPELKKKGFEMVTITELFAMRKYGMPPANNGVIYKNAFNNNR